MAALIGSGWICSLHDGRLFVGHLDSALVYFNLRRQTTPVARYRTEGEPIKVRNADRIPFGSYRVIVRCLSELRKHLIKREPRIRHDRQKWLSGLAAPTAPIALVDEPSAPDIVNCDRTIGFVLT
ncbi:hypothetical protein [Rhizobium sp. SG570]|uniref:hypothetical protein n=1 Tax=Rhizobium sp. SG570 TaxID=2587113 RepID=UPI0011A85635|nr:hypothetical protein [Rhizobium sp. SG570]NKJ40197.1 hypothetical protein [Rhizobium sp. SG570]